MELPLFKDYHIEFVPLSVEQHRNRSTFKRLGKQEAPACQYVRLRYMARSSSLPDLGSVVREGAGVGLKEGEGGRGTSRKEEGMKVCVTSEDDPMENRQSQTASTDPELDSSGLSNDSKDNPGSSTSEGKATGGEIEGRGQGRGRARGGRGRRRVRGGKNRRRKQSEGGKKADGPGVASPAPSAHRDNDLYLPFNIYKQLAHAEVEGLAKKLHDYFEMQSSVYEENRMDLLQQLYLWREAAEKSDNRLQTAQEEIERLRQLNEVYRVKLNSWRRGHRGRQEGAKRSRTSQPSSNETASISPQDPQSSELPPVKTCVGAMGDVGEGSKEDKEEPRLSVVQEDKA